MERATENRRRITILLGGVGVALIVTGLLVTPFGDVMSGMWAILTSPGILITDYVALANLGAALANAGILTLMALAIAWIIDAKFTGYLIAGAFTMMGFAMFGKNPFNTFPIFVGIYIYGRVAGREHRDLLAPYLFGTTLGPLVGQTAFGFDFGIAGLIGGILLGLLGGFLLAALMGHVYSIHLGYNLYNTGTTGGFVGVVVYMMMRGFGLEILPAFYWSTEHTGFLATLTAVLMFALIVLGIIWGASWASYRKIVHQSGKLATDFVEVGDLATTLVNMGLVGLLGLSYVLIVGGDLNGATMAGILTIVGFGALGKHLRNIFPIMLGVYLMCIPKIWTHSEPGPLLAALFCTTLAPIAGQFGFFAGLVVGAVHLPMVMHVGGLHGYMNLYNNGFAGGLVMLVIIGLVKGIRPEILDMHRPWYLVRGLSLLDSTESLAAED
ncbi:MAG: DUF1576 domain-containing protein [Anaerolineae bacterium]|nr:DUF1576 domain-containing protein [Anaerolineae bacterium]